MDIDGSRLEKLTDNSVDDLAPSWSPDGNRIVFYRRLTQHNWDLFILKLSDSTVRRLTETHGFYDYNPAWSPNGKWIAYPSEHWVRDGGDLVALHPDGSGERAILTSQENSSYENPSWSPHGKRLAYTECCEEFLLVTTFWRSDTYGTALNDEDFTETDPAWSPDGSMILFSRNDVNCPYCPDNDRSLKDYDLFVIPADGGASQRLEEEPSDSLGGAWSPDGSRIAFYSDRRGSFDIYVMNADGTNLVRLTRSKGNDIQPAWTAGG